MQKRNALGPLATVFPLGGKATAAKPVLTQKASQN